VGRQKGLKELKTIGKILAKKNPHDLAIDIHYGSKRSYVNESEPAGEFHKIKSWVFSEKPSFQRYQPSVRKKIDSRFRGNDIAQKVEIQKIKDPQAQIFKKVDEIKVVIELPGALPEKVDIEVIDDILSIEAEGEDQGKMTKYQKEILLPFPVEDKIYEKSYEANVLEIKLKKRKKESLS